MLELETKVFGLYFGTNKDKGIDVKYLIKTLENLEYEKVFEGELSTTFYKLSKVHEHRKLRLSKNYKHGVLTIDKKYETVFDNYKKALTIFESLGYSLNKGSMFLTSPNKQALRLREYDNGKNIVGIKTDISEIKDVKAKNECETGVSDNIKFMISLLGFESKKRIVKDRISYRHVNKKYGNEKGFVRFDIDAYTDPIIPPFLEIEANREGIKHYIKLLGLSDNPTRPWDFSDLLNHYVKK